MRALIKSFALALTVSGLTVAGLSAAAQATVCEPAPLLIRDVTIVDGSGRWSDQDIYIERGEISAIGETLELESGIAPIIIERPGAIVRPGQPAETTALFIRTSTRAPSRVQRPAILMPGVAADLVIYSTDIDASGLGDIDLEIRGGVIVGDTPACLG